MKTGLIRTWLLAAALLALPAVAQAEFTFMINNGTITIATYDGRGGAVTIPATWNVWGTNLPIVSIGDSAFSENGVTSVTIPDSVTNIGFGAFAGCGGLIHAMIGNGVTSIGNDAFEYCTSLTTAVIGNGVGSIGDSAFFRCESLPTN